MKIAYVTDSDVSDIHSWSGSIHHIYKSLKESGFHVTPVDKLKTLSKKNPYFYGKRIAYKYLLGKTYSSSRDPRVLKSYARQIESRISHSNFDVIFSPNTGLVAYLNTKIPIVIWNDATFAGLAEYHPFLRNLCRETCQDNHITEQMAFDKARLIFLTSEWAVNSALDNYHVDKNKLVKVPFGANMDSRLDLRKITANQGRKNKKLMRLLFIGTYWTEKGGNIAYEASRLIQKRNIQVELHVVGCRPPVPLPDWVKVHGFISKRTPDGRKTLDNLYLASHFLIVPTRADAFGLVFAEACAYGLPSIGTNTGGVSEIIKNNRNGFLFGMQDPPERYAEYMLKIWSSEKKLLSMSLHAFEEYKRRLNWAVASRTVKRHLMRKL